MPVRANARMRPGTAYGCCARLVALPYWQGQLRYAVPASMAGAISSAPHSCCCSSRFANVWGGVECHLETGATAMARHTLYITAVMARNLAHQSEAKAHSAIAALRHT